MAFIQVNEKAYGISSLLSHYSGSGRIINQLCNHLLSEETEGLCCADREIIASFVSRLNECTFCSASHTAIAEEMSGKKGVIEAAVCDIEGADIPDKLKALLKIAATVQRDAKEMSQLLVDTAREHGANDRDIHDTVLIAAAFCMLNRYVDGLGTDTPDDPDYYIKDAKAFVQSGSYLGK